MDHDIDDFEKDVIRRSHEIPVLADFWAEWCGPCKVLGPVLERLAREHVAEWALAKLDTERHPAVAAEYGIRSIPNVKLFVDGQVADEFVGALPERQVVEWLGKALPSRYRAQLDGARRLLLKNRESQAAEMLRSIVAAEPGNDHAVVLLGQAQLGSDPQQAVRTVETVGLGSRHLEQAQAVRTLAALFEHAADPASLPQDSVRDDYAAAIGGARARDFDTALKGLVEVVRKNKYYDDDGPRRACIAVFKLLGDDHELTRKHQAALSTALY